jgi:hypothetical protein
MDICFYSRIDIEGNHHHCHAVRSGGSRRIFIEGPMLITFHCQEVRNGRSWPKQHRDLPEEHHAEFPSSWEGTKLFQRWVCYHHTATLSIKQQKSR